MVDFYEKALNQKDFEAAGQRRAIVDIFRLEDGKIVEHWDPIQDVPEKAANDSTMF
jgi:predicted SnoaL-like aldol condensation-catalyzing enzyme